MRNEKGQFIKGSKGHLGYKHSSETIEKLRQISPGRKQSVQTIQKRIAKMTGRKLSEQTKLNISMAKKGKPNGLLGRHLSEETKEKIRIANTGFKITEETRLKLRLSHLGKPAPMKGRENLKVRGEKNFNWKGGVTKINDKIRKSIEYNDWRTAVFKRDDYTCQECGSRGYKLHAHHKKPFSYYPELRLVIENGITLCVECHKKTDTYLKNYKKKVVTGTTVDHSI